MNDAAANRVLDRLGALAEKEQFTKPGTANVSPADLKKLGPLMKHYASKAHPFTACKRDQMKHGLSEGHANRRCAVLKDLIRGTTKWRNREAEREAAIDAARLLEATARLVGRDKLDALLEEAGVIGPLEADILQAAAIVEVFGPRVLEGEDGTYMLKCPKCGTKQSARNSSCTSCGHDLGKARKAKFAKMQEALAAADPTRRHSGTRGERLLGGAGAALREQQVRVRGYTYRREGRTVRVPTYWRDAPVEIMADLLDTLTRGDRVALPDGVVVRKDGRESHSVVRGPGDVSVPRGTTKAMSAEQVARRALSLSAQSRKPESWGGTTRYRNIDEAYDATGGMGWEGAKAGPGETAGPGVAPSARADLRGTARTYLEAIGDNDSATVEDVARVVGTPTGGRSSVAMQLDRMAEQGILEKKGSRYRVAARYRASGQSAQADRADRSARQRSQTGAQPVGGSAAAQTAANRAGGSAGKAPGRPTKARVYADIEQGATVADLQKRWGLTAVAARRYITAFGRDNPGKKQAALAKRRARGRKGGPADPSTGSALEPEDPMPGGELWSERKRRRRKGRAAGNPTQRHRA